MPVGVVPAETDRAGPFQGQWPGWVPLPWAAAAALLPGETPPMPGCCCEIAVLWDLLRAVQMSDKLHTRDERQCLQSCARL